MVDLTCTPTNVTNNIDRESVIQLQLTQYPDVMNNVSKTDEIVFVFNCDLVSQGDTKYQKILGNATL